MNSSKYKIVFCTPALYSAGGVERVITVKANYFAERLGYDVTIIVTEGKGNETYFPVSNRVKIINFEIGFEELWKLSFVQKIIVYFKKQYRYKKLLTKLLLDIRPDITISTLRREINFLTKVKDGSFKIGELHVNRTNYRTFSDKESSFIKRLISHYWMNNLLCHLKELDNMVVLTDNAMKDWVELNQVVKIPDPLPFKIDVKSKLETKRIISIGRYDNDKGNDLLLQVWAKVEKKIPNWTLDIYGNGNQEPYHRIIEIMKIEKTRCHLHGPTKGVKKEYLNSSLFVLPSRYEGFGLVIIEAMACGVPVISFDCENGPRSIIADGINGYLIPPFDIDAFANKIISLVKDVNLRKQIGERAQKSAEKYNIEIIGTQWKRLFDELMDQK